MKQHKNIHLSVKDYLVSGEIFDLVYNIELDLLSTSPMPSTADLAKYYESKDYISHTDGKNSLISLLYQWVKKWSLSKKTELITKRNGAIGDLLDVGAGTGDFLNVAKEKGWKVEGMEPNSNASKLASEKGIDLKPTLSHFEGRQFDVVTLWHVLEHVPNLEETITQLSKLIKPDGVLVVAVPNYKSYDANHYGKFWAAYDVPRHLWHFSKKSIERIFGENFKLEATKPMLFDSFYVSLLSEKYKGGSTFSMKAILIGLLSNLKALRSKEYSSHIYCFRKTV